MSTELSLFQGGVPTFLKGATDTITSSLAGAVNSRRISIKGGVFREFLNGNEVRVSEDRAMHVIIINAAPHVARTYFTGTYVEGEKSPPPDCWSSDSQRPDPSAENKQCDTCLDCPQNIKGSGQGDSRACRFSQRIAVMLDGELDSNNVYQITLPATSIFGDGGKNKMPLQSYARYLSSHGLPIFGVVTEMRFDIDAPTPKLIFKPVRPITEAEYAIVQQNQHTEPAVRAITMTVPRRKDSAEGFETAKPKATNALAAPKKAKAEPEPEAVAEPKVITPKKEAVPAVDANLGSLVSEWDD